jgi:hypothetical protein
MDMDYGIGSWNVRRVFGFLFLWLWPRPPSARERKRKEEKVLGFQNEVRQTFFFYSHHVIYGLVGFWIL